MNAHSELKCSFVIPTFNEAACISPFLKRLQEYFPTAEIIVVDGGSTDGTSKIALERGVIVIESEKGRGIQCNTGAKKATGEILLFLHADTNLPANALSLIASCFKDPQRKIAKFQLRFDNSHPLLRSYQIWTRFDSIFTSFGDQCIIVRKSFFEELGGFPNWPLFEDVHFFQLARKKTKIIVLPVYAVTSARRFLKRGIIRTQLLNGWLLLKYVYGVSPQKLNEQYQKDFAISLPSFFKKKHSVKKSV